jgi:hypothetical protein
MTGETEMMICDGKEAGCYQCWHKRVHAKQLQCVINPCILGSKCRPATDADLVMAKLVGEI